MPLYSAIFATRAIVGDLSHQQRANGTQGVWTHTSPTRRKEVALSTKAVIDRLAKVQREYLKRLLGLNPRKLPSITSSTQSQSALHYHGWPF